MNNTYQKAGLLSKLFQSLQGLIYLPIGLLCTLLGMERAGFWQIPDPYFLIVYGGLALLAVLASTFISRYYRLNYGLVTPIPKINKTRWFMVFAFVVLLFIAFTCDLHWLAQVPLSFTAFVFALGLWFFPSFYENARPQYKVLAVLVLLISLLPLTGVLSKHFIYGRGPALDVLILGCIITLGSLVDHLLLDKAFSELHLKQDNHE